MTTEKQTQANRANALNSTGPRGEAGKSRSKMNARTHGLSAADILLPDEDVDAYHGFQNALIARLAPEGELEHQLVSDIGDCRWRLMRVRRLEPQVICHLGREAEVEAADSAARRHLYRRCGGGGHERGLFNNDANYRALWDRKEELSAAVAAHAGSAAAALIFDARHADALERLSRHEVRIERSMYRAIEMLLRLQGGRQGRQAPSAAATEYPVTAAAEAEQVAPPSAPPERPAPAVRPVEPPASTVTPAAVPPKALVAGVAAAASAPNTAARRRERPALSRGPNDVSGPTPVDAPPQELPSRGGATHSNFGAIKMKVTTFGKR